MNSNACLGIVLAAGSGSRLGQPKVTVSVGGQRLVDRQVSLFHQAGIPDIVVVLGAEQIEVPGVEVLVNRDWATGLGTSLACALERAEAADVDRCVVVPVDTPWIWPADIAAAASAAAELAVTAYGKHRWGHPVMISSSHYQAICESLSGNSGARHYLKSVQDQVDVLDSGNPRGLFDIDTVADLLQAEGWATEDSKWPKPRP